MEFLPIASIDFATNLICYGKNNVCRVFFPPRLIVLYIRGKMKGFSIATRRVLTVVIHCGFIHVFTDVADNVCIFLYENEIRSEFLGVLNESMS